MTTNTHFTPVKKILDALRDYQEKFKDIPDQERLNAFLNRRNAHLRKNTIPGVEKYLSKLPAENKYARITVSIHQIIKYLEITEKRPNLYDGVLAPIYERLALAIKYSNEHRQDSCGKDTLADSVLWPARDVLSEFENCVFLTNATYHNADMAHLVGLMGELENL